MKIFNTDIISLNDTNESLLQEEVGEFFESQGIDIIISTISQTSKSIFGNASLVGESVFYKLANHSRIRGELKGFEVAHLLPHGQIIESGFSGNVGFYLQEFIEPSLLASDISNVCIYGEDDIHNYLSSYQSIFDKMAHLFMATQAFSFSKSTNDAFFKDRLEKGGRADIYYQNGLLLEGNNIFDSSLLSEADSTKCSIRELLKYAKGFLSYSRRNLFGISHGDPTEANFSLSGFFYDFETAGYNTFFSDISIFVFYCCFSSFLFSLRYNASNDSQKKDIGFSFEHSSRVDFFEDQIYITSDFKIPWQKLEVLKVYVETYIEPIERMMTLQERLDAVESLKVCILIRILLVRNLNDMECCDISLSLYLVKVFTSEGSEKSISEYIYNRIFNL